MCLFDALVVRASARIPGAVYAGRPGRYAPPGDPCRWGNYAYTRTVHSDTDALKAVGLYCRHLINHPALVAEIRRTLRSRVLACHCAPRLCHAHLIAEVANAPLEHLVDLGLDTTHCDDFGNIPATFLAAEDAPPPSASPSCSECDDQE